MHTFVAPQLLWPAGTARTPWLRGKGVDLCIPQPASAAAVFAVAAAFAVAVFAVAAFSVASAAAAAAAFAAAAFVAAAAAAAPAAAASVRIFQKPTSRKVFILHPSIRS